MWIEFCKPVRCHCCCVFVTCCWNILCFLKLLAIKRLAVIDDSNSTEVFECKTAFPVDLAAYYVEPQAGKCAGDLKAYTATVHCEVKHFNSWIVASIRTHTSLFHCGERLHWCSSLPHSLVKGAPIWPTAHQCVHGLWEAGSVASLVPSTDSYSEG